MFNELREAGHFNINHASMIREVEEFGLEGHGHNFRDGDFKINTKMIPGFPTGFTTMYIFTMAWLKFLRG